MTGGSAGAILGAPAGLVGSAAGGTALAAAMYPPAKQFANSIDRFRGMQPGEPDQATPLLQSVQDFDTGLKMEAAGAVLNPLLRGAGSAIKTGVVKGLSTALGPSSEAIEARMANPDLANAPSYSQLAYQLPKTLNVLKGKITAATDAAGSLLSPDPSDGIPKSQINQMIGNLMDDLKTSGVFVGPAQKTAGTQMSSLMSDIGDIMKPAAPSVQMVDAIGKNIPFNPPDVNLPETTVKDILQAARKNINWEDKGSSVINSALTNFSGQLDQMLKNQNPDYAQAMKPVGPMMGTLNDTMNAFGLTHQTGEGIQPTDSTISKLSSVPGDKKAVSQDILNDLKNQTGVDYVKAAKNYGLAKQFEGGSPNGSRRVNLFAGMGAGTGAALGGLAGHPEMGATIGGAGGSAVGAVADKFGGPMAGVLADKFAAAQKAIAALSQTMPAELARRTVMAAIFGGSR